jgi:ParB family chromosome partitioning protein
MDAILVNPFRCRMWEFHDRLGLHVNEDTCKCEIESFERYGQLIPVLGRPLRNNSNHDVELLYGARRLFVAQHLNKPLQINLRELSDKEAIIAMDIENRQRKNVSPYEQGLAYAEWMRAKHFDSQDDIAKALRISTSQVSRLLKVARLPAVVIDAFETPLEIRERWGLELSSALDDPRRKPTIIDRARALVGTAKKPVAAEVFRTLLSNPSPGRKPRAPSHDEVVEDELGNPLFRIREQRNTIALLLPQSAVSGPVMQDIREALKNILSRQLSPTLRPSTLSNKPASVLMASQFAIS